HLTDSTTWLPKVRPSRLMTRAEKKFNLWELLGGRGLAGGEERVITEFQKQIPSNSIEQPSKFSSEDQNEQKGPAGMVSATSTVDDSAFEKELQGLTGGFPGGEKGLQKFLKDNPPPAKQFGSSESETMNLSKSKAPPLPLLMPGMIVIVKNPKNPYHMYSGIVQRVTDGKAGVLFEGGNWDKLVTFKLEDLERRSKGPPMSNPKSAILENINIP
ncbi:hypothetical protein SUGI_0366100, partial [Cryptomeria japonica]